MAGTAEGAIAHVVAAVQSVGFSIGGEANRRRGQSGYCNLTVARVEHLPITYQLEQVLTHFALIVSLQAARANGLNYEEYMSREYRKIWRALRANNNPDYIVGLELTTDMKSDKDDFNMLMMFNTEHEEEI